MILLEKFNLIYDKGFPLKLKPLSNRDLSKSMEILIDLVDSLNGGGLYFNTQRLLLNISQVMYEARETFNYFPEVGRGSIIVTTDTVYFTSMDDDFPERRISEAYDKIPTHDFKKFLEDLFQQSIEYLTIQDRIVQSIYFKVRNVIEKRWSEAYDLAVIKKRYIFLLLGIKNITFKFSKDSNLCHVYESEITKFGKNPDEYILKIDEIESYLIDYIKKLRSDRKG